MGNCTSRAFQRGLLQKEQSANPLPPPPPPSPTPHPPTPHPTGKGSPQAFKAPASEGENEGVSPVPQATLSGSHGTPINSNSELSFVAFGAGCYWGTEKFMSKSFLKQPNLPEGKILSGKVGFMGPKSAPVDPSYQDVCTGRTGHVEVYHVEFCGGEAYVEAMIRYFFSFHDPTTLNRQGNDQGTQYSSVIFCSTPGQVDIANKVKNELQQLINTGAAKKLYQSVRVTTDVRLIGDSSPFYAAHDEHQDYLSKNTDGYCNHQTRRIPWAQ